MRCGCAFRCEKPLEQDDRQDHSHKAERICDGTCHGHSVDSADVFRVNLEHGLLCCSEHRGVGHGSGKKPDCIGNGKVCGPEEDHRHERADKQKEKGKEIELHASVLEG